MNSSVMYPLTATRMDETPVVPTRPMISLLIEESTVSGREILKGALEYIRKNTNWRLYLPEHRWESCVPDSACNYPGDGVIAQLEQQAVAEKVQRWGVPLIDVGDRHLLPEMPWITSDYAHISDKVCDHLLGLGYRNLAFIGECNNLSSDSIKDSFVKSVNKSERVCETYDNPVDQSWEVDCHAIRKWLFRLPRPLGVMAANGRQARRLLGACRASGIRVPEEVAVLAFGENSVLCEVTDPSLSTIVPNSKRIGYEAAAILHRRLKGDRDVPLITRVRHKSVVARKSTDCYAVDDPEIAAAARFIRDNALKGIKVTDVLEAVPMSRRVLECKFRDYLGRTPHQEILNLRLDHVKTLLVESDLSLDRIAARSGFRHVEYMTVCFKREVGCTPSSYRKNFR